LARHTPGRKKANPDAIGAKISWQAGGLKRSRLKVGGGSYLSSHDPREVLGIGKRTKIDKLEIRWPQPSGRVTPSPTFPRPLHHNRRRRRNQIITVLALLRTSLFWLYYARTLGFPGQMIPQDADPAMKLDEAVPISSTIASSEDVAKRARRHTARRLLPFLFVLYVVAFLDRMNVGAAALQMPGDLGFSDRAVGLGAGIFFLGYVLLEIPGALIAERQALVAGSLAS